MDVFNPKVWAEMVIDLFGPKRGRLFNQITMIFLMLGAIGLGGKLFFDDFVRKVVWPFGTSVFGFPESGISLDNIEAIILVLISAIVFFVVIFALFVLLAWRVFRRRVVPQEAIDKLAEHRSKGINILNTLPDQQNIPPNEPQRQQWLDSWVATWHTTWREWVDDVLGSLDKYFTQAEKLSFQRLGVFPERNMGLALTLDHFRYLSQLAQQLAILERLIEFHQERR